MLQDLHIHAHKMESAKVLVFGLIFYFLAISQADAKKSSSSSSTPKELPCTKDAEAQVDTVFGRMSGYGNISRPFPSNEEQLSKYCKGQHEDIRLVESYSKRCTKGLPKQYFSIMLYTIKGSMARICKRNHSKGKQFLSASGCMKRASDYFDGCHRNLITRLHKVKFAEDKKKIPFVCW